MNEKLRININGGGFITEIGYVQSYNYDCPDFIAMDNFITFKCVNLDDILNPESWVEIT